MDKTKSVWQKALVCLIAVVMSFTTLIGSSSELFRVSAAETRQVNRIYSANYTDKYGMKSSTQISAKATLKGGTNWSIIQMDNGNLAYCVQPEKSLTDSATYSAKTINLTTEQKELLGRIFLYSYTQTPADITNLDSYMPQYLATQLLVWEVLVGQRDENFNYISNGYAKVSSMIDKFNDANVCANVKSFYNAYESAIKADKKQITFAFENSDKANDNPFQANEDSTYTFTDKNAQLENFDITVTNGEVISKSATQLKVRADYNKTASISLVQNNCNESGERCGWVVYGDGVYQDIAEAKADPREYYVYLEGAETGSLRIKKTSDDGITQGIAFEIRNDDGYYAKDVTGAGGILTFDNLVPGKYTVTEKPTVAQSNKYNTVLEKVVFVYENKTTEVNFENTLVSGHLSITKYSEDGIVEGVGFDLMSYYLDADGNEVVYRLYDSAYTDETGYVEWNDLPYYAPHNGYELYYQIEEFTLPSYTEPVYYIPGHDNASYKEISFVLLGDDVAISCQNTLKRSDVLVVKKDYETGETVPREGTEFQIYDANGELVILTDADGNSVNTFVTDSTGKIKLPEPLVYGSYTLVEVKAPVGYVIDPTPVAFSVTRDGEVVTVEKKNTEQKANIVVTKVGDAFSSVVTNEDSIYKPEFAEANLSGATFDVIAAQDIYYSDGDVRIAKDTVVDTITTGADGTAKSKDLYLGDYYVVEKTAPTGYVLNETVYLVSLEYAGQEVVVNSIMFSIANAHQQVKINVAKFVESDYDFNIISDNAVQYINFGLYAAENITASDGTMIPADGLIETIGLQSDFTTSFNTKLPFGKYYIKEISTDEHYVISDEIYEFEFAYKGQEIQTVEINVDAFKFGNYLKRGFVNGVKVNSETKVPLSGATIGLFFADETEFTEDTAILTAVSEIDGSFSFDEIPYGSYLVKELEAPTGYILSDLTYPVVIDEDGDDVEITIENDEVRGNVQIEKYDSETEELLSGAIFTVYKDYGSDENYAEVDPEYGVLTEENGIYTLTGVTYGDYLLKETLAPEGYVIDEKYYSFKIRVDGETVIISNDESTDRFYNKPITGDVDGLKVNALNNKVLGGALIGLFAADEKEFTAKNAIATVTSDKEGKFAFNDIRYGNYQVAEIKAPTGYILSEKTYPVIIDEDGDLVKITIKNEPVRGDIEGLKVNQIDEPLSGALIGIFSADETDFSDTTAIETYVTDENGFFGFYDYIYGEYLVAEIEAPTGYILTEEKHTVVIDENGETVRIEITNEPVRGDIEGIKVGEENEPLAGAVIGLFSADETEFTEDTAIAAYTTEKNGKFAFNDIIYGKYQVVEIAPPTGHILTDKIYPVTIDENGETISVEIENIKIRGNIEGTKVGEEFEPLSGAVIGLFANGESEFTEDTAISTVKTEKDGKFAFSNIEYGKYVVAEIKAPVGYVLTDEKFPVVIDNNDETILLEIANGEIRGDIEGIKVGEKNEPLAGAVIGLFAGDESEFTEDTAIATVETLEDGKFAFKGVKFGEYIIAEIEAPKGYVLTDEHFPVIIDDNGEVITITIANNNVYGDVSGLKVNEADEPLAGALIGLFYKGETTFTEDAAIMTDTSDNNGAFEFNDIRYGEYVVAEIKAPTGYLLSDEAFPVVIDKNDEIIQIEIVNMEIEGSVVVNKYDSETEELLSGAEFTVYVDENSNGTLDPEEIVYGVLKEITEGVYKLSEIPFGYYILKETTAPEGYVIDEGEYAFVIDKHEKEVVVTNSDSSDRFYNVQTTTTTVTTTTTTTTTSETTTTTTTTSATTTSTSITTTEITTETTVTTSEITTISTEITTSEITTETTVTSTEITTGTIPVVSTEPAPQTGDRKSGIVSVAAVVGLISLAGILLTYRKKKNNNA